MLSRERRLSRSSASRRISPRLRGAANRCSRSALRLDALRARCSLPRLLAGEAMMQRSRIVGTGTYLPSRKVTNDDLIKEFGIDTSDAWIRERSGIGARRIAAPDE